MHSGAEAPRLHSLSLNKEISLRGIRISDLIVIGLGVIAVAPAASDPVLHVHESITIAAPPDAVWAVVKDFDNLQWHPAVASTHLDTGRNNERNAVRTLVLNDGARIVERLQDYDAAGRIQRYTILESPLPVTDYTASIAVRSDGPGSAIVSWDSRFRPAADATMSDDPVREMISGIFLSGLQHLKQTLEDR